ncbi:LysR substrate-binding domain-containing protein [Caulobacter sp. 1776]|uniref:LysR substrate-binding domain-containing protein n=1 Tax=Caulobacter sp. 1776 TaxID=3156420 RepID=UPI003390932D
MDRDLLLHLPVVACVARRKSFAAAAAELDLSASAVSHAVRMVEERLKTPIFARTTRSVAVTEAGQRFLDQTAPALDQIREAFEAAQAQRGRVTGTLKINAPRIAFPIVLTDLLAASAIRHPHLTVEVVSEDASIDIVAQGYDAGVRLGEMIAEDMVAVRLTPPLKVIMVASPTYLARAGEPRTIADLQSHACIGYRQLASGAAYAWELLDQGRDVSISVSGPARVTDPLAALELAVAGVGIAYMFEHTARRALASGQVRQVLPATAIEEPGLFLYFPRRAAEAPKLRAFIDLARARLASQVST